MADTFLNRPPLTMVTRSSFVTHSVQASTFLEPDTAIASSKIVAIVLQGFGHLFDGEMQVVPIPADAPPEIPRVLIQSSDRSLQFNAAPARVDLIVSQPGSVSEGVETAASVLDAYCRSSRSTVNRVAFVVHRVCEHKTPAEVLISQFCSPEAQKGPFARSAAFEIHNHKEYVPSGLDYVVNSWMRCRCGMVGSDSRPVISVEQDINTLIEKGRRFSTKQILEFFQAMPNAADEIFQRYFLETTE